MDGKDKIIEKILSDAENYRASVTLKADEDYDVLVGEATEKASALINAEEEVLKKEQAESLKRKKVVADLDGKKLYLSKKTDAVNDVFSLALNKLNNLEKSAYKTVIERFIKENAKPFSTVVLSKHAPINASDMTESFKDLNLKYRFDGEFSGGVIIENDGLDVNLSFEAVLNGIKEDYETKVAEKLFD